MKEDFLHYIWKYKLLPLKKLVTLDGCTLTILKEGMYNTNAGPDFLNVHLRIDGQVWVGNVEIHVKSLDWYLHNHEKDKNYEAVILHVVWEYNGDVFMKNNRCLPTLELKNIIDEQRIENYQNLFSKKRDWIPCGSQIRTVSPFVLSNWLERLYFERLEGKSRKIKGLLKASNKDYEAVLFQLLTKNFGLKVNKDAFLNLGKSLAFTVVRRESFNEKSLSALLFGQGGFLEDDKVENEYYSSLKKEYQYLKHKYSLNSIGNHQFEFFRMRPNNFPTIRIAQLVSLYHAHQGLFSKLMKFNRIEMLYEIFDVEINDFWKKHYTFRTTSKSSRKKITKQFIDLLIINTLVPLKFVFGKDRGEEELRGIAMLMQLKAETNNIVDKFKELLVVPKNALESQALLELYNNYCKKKRCLNCAVGNDLIKKLLKDE
ncbi:DUF2851 family protein [Tenacibaculum maritimum]|uniref:DUF2851 family protein n=1 Tax=Tenacibaculum maritimum TaxID=107401 RepID=UPI0012E64960|nr:DUF2851 family protein [Tenacibaculum maritimum]CAA0214119.1 conserved hypothetical protein [Tenacibaculum maritimum]